MEATIEITKLFAAISNDELTEIIKLPQSGSDRIYYRIFTKKKTFIATKNNNVQENNTFISFTNHFKEKGLPVPQILAVNENRNIYIQEDAGTNSLLDVLIENGFTDEVYELFRKSLAELAKLQIKGDQGLNYNLCLTAKEFGRQAIMSDLLYFKYYFLDTLKLPYDKQLLLNEFEILATFLHHPDTQYFMFRDFQSRNIIAEDNNLCFIDYQGGMKGALQYDVASLLWQAKAELSNEWKERLLHDYMDEADKLLPQPLDRKLFAAHYNGYVLLRLLQVLGAYGFRGLFERKAHFVTSIPLALRNLKTFLNCHQDINENAPEFMRILQLVVSDEIINRFENIQADENTPLLITITSFSYKKGLPKDESGHGGGFVFDCRGLLNPGRYEYKCGSGLDKNVQTFLEEKTKMNEFLNSVYNLVDISVEDYIKRKFDHLSIAFGCTGGQHRSVYSAEQTARHLRNKYKVKTEVKHYNQDNWVKEIKPKEETTEPRSNRRKQRTHAGIKSLS